MLIATSSACGVIHAANTVIHVHVCKFDRLRPSAVTAKYELAVFDGPKLTVTVPDIGFKRPARDRDRMDWSRLSLAVTVTARVYSGQLAVRDFLQSVYRGNTDSYTASDGIANYQFGSLNKKIY